MVMAAWYNIFSLRAALFWCMYTGWPQNRHTLFCTP